MLPNSNSLSDAFLKKTDCIFFPKGNSWVSKEQLPRHWLTLPNAYLSPTSQGLSERFVGVEGRNFPPVTSFQLHWTILTFWVFFQSTHSPAQDRSGAIPGYFHRGRLPHDVKTLSPWYTFCWFDGTRQSSHLPSMKSAAPLTYLPPFPFPFPFLSSVIYYREYLPEG